VQSLFALIIIAAFALSVAASEILPQADEESLDALQADEEESFDAVQATIDLFGFRVVFTIADPGRGVDRRATFDLFDMGFTVIFSIELVIELFIDWWWPFWNNGWDVFDFVVVVCCWVTFSLPSVPALNLMRSLRVFRVVKIFKQMKSMNIMIKALGGAVIPMANAFLILLLVTAIYAVIGVEMFKDRDPKFSKFSESMFTMIQCATGDDWAAGIARPLFGRTEQIDYFVAVYFTSYMLLAGIVLLNVVVAVLLDEFILAVSESRQEGTLKLTMDRKSKMETTAIDPFLATLTKLNSVQNLERRIQDIYACLDVNLSGSISFEEMTTGLKRLNFEPSIHLSHDDFAVMTEGVELNEKNEIAGVDFQQVMMNQLQLYIQRHLHLYHCVCHIRFHVMMNQLQLYIQRHISNRLVDMSDEDNPIKSVLLVLKHVTVSMKEQNLNIVRREERMQQDLERASNEVQAVSEKLDMVLSLISAPNRSDSRPSSIDLEPPLFPDEFLPLSGQ
ncbi:Ion transport protein-domain-containing protein, partial [Baffinella frigidus]